MGVSYPVSLMIISLIINRTAGLSYSSMAAWHKKSGVCRFFCWFFLFSRRVIMGVMFLIRRKPVHRGESAFSIS